MRTKIILVCIIFLGLFLRVYQLGSNPPSLDWDEASMGYNAYAILKTGADEYGNKFPLSIRSFDDYKPAMYTYLAVPSIAVFGLTEFGVRLPSAVMGTIAILLVYFLTKEVISSDFFWREKFSKNTLALFAAFFFSISPWSLQFSRAAFEGNVGLTWFLFGFLFFLYGLRRPSFFIFSAIGFIASLYSYHNFRLVVPVLLLASCLLFWKELKIIKKTAITAAILLGICAIPVYASFITLGSAGSRLSMVTIFSDPNNLDKSIQFTNYDNTHNDKFGAIFHNRRLVFFTDIAKGYFDHFNFDFLFFHGDSGRQHHAVEMGMQYFWDIPFVLCGMYLLIKNRTKKIIMLLLVFILAPLPSAITTGTPHPVRAIAMIPFLQICIAVGFMTMWFALVRLKKPLLRTSVMIIVIFGLVFNFAYYLHQYYVHTPVEYGDFWQYGYKQAFEALLPIEKNYHTIIFTYKYDQPYIYYLFYRKIDPFWYQTHWDTGHSGKIERMTRDIGQYQFHNVNWAKEKDIPNALIIAAPDEVPRNIKNYIIKEIKFPNGKTALKIIAT